MLYIKSYSQTGEKAMEFDLFRALKEDYAESGIEAKYSITWEDIQKHLFTANEKVKVKLK